MPASLVSLLSWPFRAIARRLPSGVPTLAWAVEGGVSVAVWTAPEGAADTGTVSGVRLEIRPNDVPRLPFVLTVSPDGYMTASFFVGDLETARALALRQLAVARRLPAAPLAGSAVAADALPFDVSPDTGMFRPAAEATEQVEARDEAA